jgi:hypothetical protein
MSPVPKNMAEVVHCVAKGNRDNNDLTSVETQSRRETSASFFSYCSKKINACSVEKDGLPWTLTSRAFRTTGSFPKFDKAAPR